MATFNIEMRQRVSGAFSDIIYPKAHWANIDGKPSTFTPTSHEHSAVDITSGTLPLARGGTNRSDGYAVGVVETRANVLTKTWTGTQAQYDAIGTKDENTLYFIEEE
jgi:hypothetical protein